MPYEHGVGATFLSTGPDSPPEAGGTPPCRLEFCRRALPSSADASVVGWRQNPTDQGKALRPEVNFPR